MQTKTKTALGVGTIGAAAGAAFLWLVPQSLWWKCPVHLTTGLYCPGCGGQRWALAILQGRFEDAWHYNQLFTLSPLIFLVILLMHRFNTTKRTNTIALWALGAVVAGFMVWRNFEPQVAFLNS